MRAGTWRSKDCMGFHLWGKTLGAVGLGNIGGRVALKGRLAFGMRVLACAFICYLNITNFMGQS